MKPIDFDSCENGYRDYGGSDSKISRVYDGIYYMVKLPTEKQSTINDLQTSYVNNVISEYVSSQIIKSIGLPVHNTLLGFYNGEIVVACEDFNTADYTLQEFSWFMKNIYRKDEIGRIIQYRQLYETIENNELLRTIKDEAIKSYWEMFIADALIGNFDRHKDNWGYLVSERFKDIKPAPIYDCGSSLYPELSEESMEYVLSNQEEIDKRLFEFPNAAINKNDNNKKISKFGYYELLSEGIDENCNKALINVVPDIDIDKINRIIDDVDIISDVRKTFYKTMIKERYDRILLDCYNMTIDKSTD